MGIANNFRRRLWKTPLRDLVRGRITGRLDIDRLLEESSLSEAAAGKVRNVVKRTRLWRLEKVDVANELIAHFFDGIEGGTPIEELIENFGDEKQTAKLIRRAKKRQRPVVWQAFAWARLCFAVFFGVYFVAALYLMTGSPSVTTDYLVILNRKAAGVPADEAAWPIYREALLEMGYSEHGDDRKFPIDAHYRPGDEEWPQLSVFLTEHAGALARVREAADREKSGYLMGFHTTPDDAIIFEPWDGVEDPYSGPHPSLMRLDILKNLGPMRLLARLMSADCARALEAGDADTAYADILTQLGLARHTAEQATLVSGLVRISILAHTYKTTQEVLVSRPDLWTDEQLRNLAHRFAAIDIRPEDMLNGGRLYFYDYLQRTYTDDGHGGGRVVSPLPDDLQIIRGSTAKDVAGIASRPALAAMMAPRDEIRKMYDGLMDRAIIETRRPLWLHDESEAVEETVEKLRQSSMRNRIRYMPVLLSMTFHSTVRTTLQTEAGLRDGVLVGIGLELYRREYGAWPGALEELVPGYLPGVPVDRLTGEAVRYLVTEDGPVVYSVGVDGDDDGGRPPVDQESEPKNDMASPNKFTGEARSETEHDGDWVLWPVPWEE